MWATYFWFTSFHDARLAAMFSPLLGAVTSGVASIFNSGLWMTALSNSLVVGAISTALARALGTLAELAFSRRNLPAQVVCSGC